MPTSARSPKWIALALLAAGLAPAAARAAEPQILYPCTVYTTGGREFHLETLGHEMEEGSFLYYDGDEQGRVSWRDLDKIRFIQNIKGVPGANAQHVSHTERVELFYLDGTIRQVNLVIGRIYGHDGYGERAVLPNNLILIDFDESRIAPLVYKTCERGHTFENEDYSFCPYDGLPLTAVRVR
jgi:hypothetical protein